MFYTNGSYIVQFYKIKLLMDCIKEIDITSGPENWMCKFLKAYVEMAYTCNMSNFQQGATPLLLYTLSV